MSENTEKRCQQCGAVLLPKWRFCAVCSAHIPGAPRQAHGQLAEVARHLPSTQEPDKTMVFVPELRAARLERTRRRKILALLAVLSCVALAVSGSVYWRRQEQKKAQAAAQRRAMMARRELDLYAHSLDNFFADVGRYPSAKEGLGALLKRPSELASWRGPYLEGDYSVDPWGNEYVYQVFGDGTAYALFTYGPEGESAGRYFLQVSAGNAPPTAVPTANPNASP